MFEKSRRSFISGARGTYRVRDSSVDISATAAAAASATSSSSTCGNNNNVNVGNGNGISPVVGPTSSSGSTFRHYTGKIGRAGKKLSVNVVFLDDTQHTFEVEVITEKINGKTFVRHFSEFGNDTNTLLALEFLLFILV